MNKENKDPLSTEEAFHYKKIGTNLEKKKKIKKILFWSLSVATVGIIVGITFSIKKQQNEYYLWKNKSKIYQLEEKEKIYDNKYISYSNKKYDDTKSNLIKKLVANNFLEKNDALKTLNFVNKKNDIYTTQITNIIDNTIDDCVNFDAMFINKKTKQTEVILQNINVKCKTTKEAYSLKSNEKNALENISKRLESINFKFRSENNNDKVNELKKKIKNYNEMVKKYNTKEDDSIDVHFLGMLFQKYFYSDFGDINFFPYLIQEIKYDENENKISFKYKTFILTNTTEKYKRIKFNYFRYISDGIEKNYKNILAL